MKAKDLEKFHDTLVAQYRDMIREAIYESEHDHKTRMDLAELNRKFNTIMKAAKVDGLTETVIHQLIDEAMPASASKAA